MYSKTNVDETDAVSIDEFSAGVKNLGYELRPNEMRVNLWTLDTGDSMVLHRQAEQEELYFVLEGSGEMQVDDETFEIGEGDVVVVQPEAWRYFTASEPLEVFIVGAPNVKDDGVRADKIPEKELE